MMMMPMIVTAATLTLVVNGKTTFVIADKEGITWRLPPNEWCFHCNVICQNKLNVRKVRGKGRTIVNYCSAIKLQHSYWTQSRRLLNDHIIAYDLMEATPTLRLGLWAILNPEDFLSHRG